MGRQRPSTWLGIGAGLPLLSDFALYGRDMRTTSGAARAMAVAR
jgi:hypothetical protein